MISGEGRLGYTVAHNCTAGQRTPAQSRRSCVYALCHASAAKRVELYCAAVPSELAATLSDSIPARDEALAGPCKPCKQHSHPRSA